MYVYVYIYVCVYICHFYISLVDTASSSFNPTSIHTLLCSTSSSAKWLLYHDLEAGFLLLFSL